MLCLKRFFFVFFKNIAVIVTDRLNEHIEFFVHFIELADETVAIELRLFDAAVFAFVGDSRVVSRIFGSIYDIVLILGRSNECVDRRFGETLEEIEPLHVLLDVFVGRFIAYPRRRIRRSEAVTRNMLS